MWKCEKCDQEFERLEIVWGESGGQKVDVIDYFCPYCGNTGYKEEPALTYIGTVDERNDYWDKEWSGKYELIEREGGL